MATYSKMSMDDPMDATTPAVTATTTTPAAAAAATVVVPHPKTGLVHSTMTRDATNKSIIYFWLEDLTSSSTTNTPLFYATKESAHSYDIHHYSSSSCHQNNNLLAGSVGRIQANLSNVTYSALDGPENEIAIISYKVPTVTEYIRDRPPRRIHVVLASHNETGGTTVNEQHQLALESKMPYTKPNGRVGLNFQGRGRISSNKNMQLVIAGGETQQTKNDVLFQMAKWDNEVFHVDFAAAAAAHYSFIITPLQAFAIGLAQLDL